MKSTFKCPKCDFEGTSTFTECPTCGIVVSKYIQKMQKEAEKQDYINKVNQSLALAGLVGVQKLFIRQQLENTEVWLGLETRNRYTVNFNLFEATEMRTSIGAILSRLFVGNWRPFTIEILNREGHNALTLERPFRFYFHELEIYQDNGELLGTVQRQFGILRRHYTIYDSFDRELFTLTGPILHPWTFTVFQNGIEKGEITKKWSGLFKEVFSKADDFGIEFPHNADTIQKALLMGAVFLIDFVHFEKT